jgi:hypothetical protein
MHRGFSSTLTGSRRPSRSSERFFAQPPRERLAGTGSVPCSTSSLCGNAPTSSQRRIWASLRRDRSISGRLCQRPVKGRHHPTRILVHGRNCVLCSRNLPYMTTASPAASRKISTSCASTSNTSMGCRQLITRTSPPRSLSLANTWHPHLAATSCLHTDH